MDTKSEIIARYNEKRGIFNNSLSIDISNGKIYSKAVFEKFTAELSNLNEDYKFDSFFGGDISNELIIDCFSNKEMNELKDFIFQNVEKFHLILDKYDGMIYFLSKRCLTENDADLVSKIFSKYNEDCFAYIFSYEESIEGGYIVLSSNISKKDMFDIFMLLSLYNDTSHQIIVDISLKDSNIKNGNVYYKFNSE